MVGHALTLADAEDLFDRRRRAWLAADEESYLDLFAAGLEIRMPGRDEPVRGRDRYADIVRRSFAWAAPESFEFHHLAVRDDVIMAEWTISTRRRSDGARFRWEGMSVARIDGDGRIAWWREYWDPRQVAEPVSIENGEQTDG
jgi:ketosteroid isomerase-like protein